MYENESKASLEECRKTFVSGNKTVTIERSKEENQNKQNLFKYKVKLQRAQGECLGTMSRRRTRQAAKSCGKAHIAIDPQVSEWGNLAGVNARSTVREYIAGSR